MGHLDRHSPFDQRLAPPPSPPSTSVTPPSPGNPSSSRLLLSGIDGDPPRRAPRRRPPPKHPTRSLAWLRTSERPVSTVFLVACGTSPMSEKAAYANHAWQLLSGSILQPSDSIRTITTLDWYDLVKIGDGFAVVTVPQRASATPRPTLYRRDRPSSRSRARRQSVLFELM